MPLPLGEVFVPKPNIKGAEGGCGRAIGKPSHVHGNFILPLPPGEVARRAGEGCFRRRPAAPHPLTPSRGKGKKVSLAPGQISSYEKFFPDPFKETPLRSAGS